MADYFLLLDAALFEGQMRPALAASWRRRSFEPCRALCAALLPRVEAFTARYHVGEGEPLAAGVCRGLLFRRDFWQTLVGELLFHAAAEVPELQTCADTLRCLLAPERHRQGAAPREHFVPIEQAHFGTRELTFGAATYRPDHCGLNDLGDVRRLDAYLCAVDPARWHVADLVSLGGPADEEERAEELEVARDWFPPLRDAFRRAAEQHQVVVHERL